MYGVTKPGAAVRLHCAHHVDATDVAAATSCGMVHDALAQLAIAWMARLKCMPSQIQSELVFRSHREPSGAACRQSPAQVSSARPPGELAGPPPQDGQSHLSPPARLMEKARRTIQWRKFIVNSELSIVRSP